MMRCGDMVCRASYLCPAIKRAPVCSRGCALAQSSRKYMGAFLMAESDAVNDSHRVRQNCFRAKRDE